MISSIVINHKSKSKSAIAQDINRGRHPRT